MRIQGVIFDHWVNIQNAPLCKKISPLHTTSADVCILSFHHHGNLIMRQLTMLTGANNAKKTKVKIVILLQHAPQYILLQVLLIVQLTEVPKIPKIAVEVDNTVRRDRWGWRRKYRVEDVVSAEIDGDGMTFQ